MMTVEHEGGGGAVLAQHRAYRCKEFRLETPCVADAARAKSIGALITRRRLCEQAKQ